MTGSVFPFSHRSKITLRARQGARVNELPLLVGKNLELKGFRIDEVNERYLAFQARYGFHVRFSWDLLFFVSSGKLFFSEAGQRLVVTAVLSFAHLALLAFVLIPIAVVAQFSNRGWPLTFAIVFSALVWLLFVATYAIACSTRFRGELRSILRTRPFIDV